MSTDPRIEAAALEDAALEDAADIIWMRANSESGACDADRRTDSYRVAEDVAREVIGAYLDAADTAATTRTFTGAEVNQAGWVCGACEPGDYAKCEDYQSACDDVAQFVNRLNGATE